GTCGAPAIPPPPPSLGAAGDPCVTHTDCEPGTYCEIDGHCRALPENEGDHCLFGCAFGDLYCDVTSETCRRYAALSAPCDPAGVNPPCDPAYAFCDPVDDICRPRPGLGDPCDSAERLCIASTWCNAGQCAAPGDAGAACTDDSQCAISCDP